MIHSTHPSCGHSTALIFALCLACVAPATLSAQTAGSGLAAGYAANAGKPINIEADALEVDDKNKVATFSGNVSATQGTFNLRARELTVTYRSKDNKSGGAASGGVAPGGGSADITQIDAKGKVLVTTDDNQTATSDWAVFDVTKQTVTIGGNVKLSQGNNMIAGQRLVIDLTTGVSRFTPGNNVASDGKPKQRLQAVFEAQGAKKKPKKGN